MSYELKQTSPIWLSEMETAQQAQRFNEQFEGDVSRLTQNNTTIRELLNEGD